MHQNVGLHALRHARNDPLAWSYLLHRDWRLSGVQGTAPSPAVSQLLPLAYSYPSKTSPSPSLVDPPPPPPPPSTSCSSFISSCSSSSTSSSSPPLLPTGLLPRRLPHRFPHVHGPLAVRPPHIAASKCAGEGGPKNCLEIDNPLPAARNMSFETISQGEDGSSHFVVAGIAYTLLTRKEWKKRRRHGRGRRRRCGAHEITVLL